MVTHRESVPEDVKEPEVLDSIVRSHIRYGFREEKWVSKQRLTKNIHFVE